MPSGIRSTRRLRSWIVEQVSSGKFHGLVWDDPAKTMFRIPWKHAGKQDFRSDEDGAIFKAWAEFKGKLTDEKDLNPASWKTRLRCALNKSPEFSEVAERSQLDISEPYKVYRLVPISEQGLVNTSTRKSRAKATTTRGRKRKCVKDSEEEEEEEEEEEVAAKIKREQDSAVEQINMIFSQIQQEMTFVPGLEPPQVELVVPADTVKTTECINEIRLNVTMIDSSHMSSSGEHSFMVSVQYLGQEVIKRSIQHKDVRISFKPTAPVPPTTATPTAFYWVPLPEAPTNMTSESATQAITERLPFMEKGVMLVSSLKGVYAKRFCQGRVYWTSPHTPSPTDINKMEQKMDPVLVFSREAFQADLDRYRVHGGSPPSTSITLCFGEELLPTEDPASKLIIAKVVFPWAEQRVQEVDGINLLRHFASQSPQEEITLDLVPI